MGGAPDLAYARDIDRICNVETYAGAGDPGVNPDLIVAQWLSANLETQAARSFIIRLNSGADANKAATLDAEAAMVGIDTGCPTARKWDPPTTPPAPPPQ